MWASLLALRLSIVFAGQDCILGQISDSSIFPGPNIGELGDDCLLSEYQDDEDNDHELQLALGVSLEEAPQDFAAQLAIIEDSLTNWGLCLQDVPGDGNCQFTAVVMAGRALQLVFGVLPECALEGRQMKREVQFPSRAHKPISQRGNPQKVPAYRLAHLTGPSLKGTVLSPPFPRHFLEMFKSSWKWPLPLGGLAMTGQELREKVKSDKPLAQPPGSLSAVCAWRLDGVFGKHE